MEFDEFAEKDSVEFKLTVLPEEEAIVQARFQDGHKSQERTVYFYDTKKLKASKDDLVVRARVTDGEADSTIKLRPADPDERWREIDDIAVEVDVVGKRLTHSAKLDRDLGERDVANTAIGELLSDEQQQLFETYAEKVELDELRVLGPIKAQKWEHKKIDGFPYKLCIETWTVEDAMHFTELSIKVPARAASTAGTAFRAFVAGIGLNPEGRDETKTKLVIEHFAGRLTQ